MKQEDITQKVISVSQCVELVRTTLQSVIGDLAVEGEISEFNSRRNDTLIFFTLKDDSSYVHCFMLRHELHIDIEDGQHVKIVGYPSLYKKNAGFHLRVKNISVMGEGALQRQLLLTKKKLESEGLFRQERKRQLPRFPEHIGIITSEDAAAFTDITRILRHRWPYARVTLVPAAVQGAPAIVALSQAITSMEKTVAPDVILLARGGGSLEDLQAFNDEQLVRQIFSCTIPFVTGIGHERDWTLADLVADVRGATPSNAAELATPNSDDIISAIDTIAEGLSDRIRARLQHQGMRLATQTSLLTKGIGDVLHRVALRIRTVIFGGESIIQKLLVHKERVDQVTRHMLERLNIGILMKQQKLQALRTLLEQTSPQHILGKGFSITRRKGKIIRSSRALTSHDILTTTFADGDVESEVT